MQKSIEFHQNQYDIQQLSLRYPLLPTAVTLPPLFTKNLIISSAFSAVEVASAAIKRGVYFVSPEKKFKPHHHVMKYF